MNMTKDAKYILTIAHKIAKKSRHEYIMPEHILYSLVLNSEKDQNSFFKCCEKADIEVLQYRISHYLEHKIPVLAAEAEPIPSFGFKKIMERAEMERQACRKKSIETADILFSLYTEEQFYSSECLRASIDKLTLLRALSHKNYETSGQHVKENRKTNLEPYAVDLTALAREKEFDPLIGRENEMDRLIQTLSRRKKNNPVVIGDAGIGKTALAEGLAQRIVSGEVPQTLKELSVFSLDMGSLIAGTEYRGQFEEKLKNVIEILVKMKKAILFIDEIHTILGAGACSNSVLDAANILKPVLVSGKLRFMGATTHEEYNKYFEKDKALSRRFQKLEITEPCEADAIAILNGIKHGYEAYHKVVYTQEAVEGAVRLSARYIHDRRLPDKAIDIIDEAGAYVRNQADKNIAKGIGAKRTEKQIIVDLPIIEKIAAIIARIPEHTVVENEKDKLKDLENNLKQKIFGQDTAVEAVVKAVMRSRAGFRAEGKPAANFLFVGPTGAGKTELARQLAGILGIPLIRLDMSEFQEKHNVSRLIGTSAGYVGYEDGGQLTDAVRKQPHAVLLLDEIEKAHPDIFNILLQITDYATLTDSHGRKADFRNIILIMTSNAGARDIGKVLIGFGERVVDESAVDDAVEKIFTPEFRNRLDAVIKFGHLSRDMMILIVRKELDAFSAQLAEKNITITVTDVCVNKLAQEGYSREFGARPVSRLIENEIKSFFVEEVIFGRLSEGDSAIVDWREGSYRVDISSENLPENLFSKKHRNLGILGKKALCNLH
jgi:ATP-dependent Clp protease ATP-binding subunit ClpA